MNTQEAAEFFNTLGHERRLEVIRLLVKAAPHGLTMGQIANQTKIPDSTLTHHITSLEKGGLITRQQENQSIICTVNIKLIKDLANYLLNECCMTSKKPAEEDKMINILFLCKANSSRSQVAEGLGRKYLGDIANISSAGSHPTKVNPMAIAVLKEIGMIFQAINQNQLIPSIKIKLIWLLPCVLKKFAQCYLDTPNVCIGHYRIQLIQD